MNQASFNAILYGWLAFGLIIFILLLFISAPYGRHTRKGWGPVIPNHIGWIIMEFPSLFLFAFFFLQGYQNTHAITWIFFFIWVAHYLYRSLIFPFRIKTKGKKMPLLIALFAIFFNLVNGTMNGIYFSSFSREYTFDWLYDARFIIGSIVLISGIVINQLSDKYLLQLRKNSRNGYQVPKGRLFNYVSCPNFLGEIMEWTGFAIMTWSPAALAFALWTFFNLVPRALEHHKWYKKEFSDYPSERKALIPFIL